MASSPLRAPAAAVAGQQQSRLLDMQKKFQQKHLAAVKGVAVGSTSTSTNLTTTTATNVVRDPPVAPVRRLGGIGVGGQQQRRSTGPGSGTGSAAPGDGDSVVQVDVKGKHQQRTAGQTNSKTATIAKKPLAAVNGVGPTGRGARRPADGGTVNANRLLLPPVVQPTVINALAAGASAAVAVASVGAAAAAGAQRPVARASKLPPATPGPPKPAAPSRRRVTATPPPPTSKPAPGPRRPAVVRRAAPAAADARPQQPVKQQLSADRGPPAPGMARCPLCSRDFAADRLPKHEEVCRRSREKDRKRKVFDTSRKRLEAVAAEAGVDVASFKKKSQKEDQRAAEKLQRKKDAWRRKHDQLVRNVRNARAVQRHLAAGGTVRDLPPELENASAEQDDPVDSDLVKCPHCGRTFNEASAERHIPLCADRQRNAAARTQNRKR